MKDILLRLIQDEDVYHDRKEHMAWIATTLYLGFSVGVVVWLNDTNRPSILNDSLLATIALYVVWVSALCFVSMQFSSRWRSVSFSTAMKRKAFRLSARPDTTDEHRINVLEFFAAHHNVALPKDVDQEVKSLNAGRRFWPFVSALLQILLLFGLFREKIDPRYKTEIPSYILMTGFFIFQLCSLWA